MARKLGNKLLIWAVTAVLAAFAIDVALDNLGWENTPGAIVEAVVSAGLMAFLYHLYHKLVIEPLKTIGDIAERIKAGDLTARAHITSSAEFRTLSGALNDMVDRLAYANEQLTASNLVLEKAVEERTHAITGERDKLSSILRSIPDGVIFISISGEIKDLNPMMEDIWGVKAAELVGKGVEELPVGLLKDSLTFKGNGPALRKCWEFHKCVDKNCPAYMSDDMRCWLISGTHCRKGVQTSVKRKREEVCSECEIYKDAMGCCAEVRELEVNGRYYKVGSALVLDDTQRALGEIKTFYDITAEKVLEKRKADFVSLVTHDLKSPLTNILGYADLILDSKYQVAPMQSEEYVSSIKSSGKKLLDMVEQYLDLTKMEAGMLGLNKVPVYPNELIEEAASDMAFQAREKNMELSLDVSAGLGAVSVDRDKMLRVVTNLISNAVKYTRDGGRVSVSVRLLASDNDVKLLEITVSDNGYGIHEEDIPYIFDRYYRSEKRSGIKGTGLGLAVVKAFVEAHGGSVTVESEPDKGSTFIVRIPAC